MSRPEEEDGEPVTEPIRHPPIANPARTRLGPVDLDPEPEETDPLRPNPAEEQ